MLAGRADHVELLTAHVFLLTSFAVIKGATHSSKAVRYDGFTLTGAPENDCATFFPRSDVGREFSRGEGNECRIVVVLIERVRPAILNLMVEGTHKLNQCVL